MGLSATRTWSDFEAASHLAAWLGCRFPSWTSTRPGPAKCPAIRAADAGVAIPAATAARATGQRIGAELVTRSCHPAPRARSIATRARGNVVQPIGLHGFVCPEIHRDFHRWRQPYELLAEFDLDSVFL